MSQLPHTSACAADPQLEKTTHSEKSVKPGEVKSKRPATKEEFAALAEEGPRPPWLPFKNQSRVHDERIEGTVIDVSAKVIEIRPKDKKETVKYPAYTLLRTGAVCHWLTDTWCYLLDDVKVGDVVLLGVGIPEMGAEVHCFYLSIRERPGDVVPPSRKPSEYTVPYHKDQQRMLDYKKRGEPLPEVVQSELDKKKFMAERGLTAPPPKSASEPPGKK